MRYFSLFDSYFFVLRFVFLVFLCTYSWLLWPTSAIDCLERLVFEMIYCTGWHRKLNVTNLCDIILMPMTWSNTERFSKFFHSEAQQQDTFAMRWSLKISPYLEHIIRPHRSTTYVDAAYRYQPSSVVCLSVCRSVCRSVGRSLLDLCGHIKVICLSGVTGKINRTVQLCSIVQHCVFAQFLEQFNRSLGWVFLTGPISLYLPSFVCMCILCLLYMYYCNMVRWTWWDWSLFLRTTTSFSALTLSVGSFDP